MEDRITVLERDVEIIKTELTLLKRDRGNAEELNARVTRIEIELVVIKGDVGQLRKDVSQLQRDVSQLQKDVSQLQKDVSQLQKDVAHLQQDSTKMTEEIVSMRMELTKLTTEHAHYATKADLAALHVNMKGWMLTIALSLITCTFAMIYPLYGALKMLPATATPQAQQQLAPAGKTAPAGVR